MLKLFLFCFFNNFIFSSSLIGVSLFSIGTESYLINNNSNYIKTWNHSRSSVGTSYLINDRSIVVQLRAEQHNFGASHGPIGGHFQKIDFDDQIIWEFFYYDSLYHPHHDFEPLSNGNILIICWEKKSQSEVENYGRVNINNQFWPLKIIELMPIGTDSVDIVWEWHLWDHLIQDIDPDLPNYGSVQSHPELLDINLVNFNNPNNGDWLHTNAIDYNETLDQIVFSSRFLDEIFIIDHSTTTEEASSHSGGNSGKGGDFLFRWGNPQNYGRGTQEDKVLNDQHGVNWINNSFIGGGNLLIFNNNPLDTTGQDHSIGNSSIIEITPPINLDNSYFIDDENAFGPEDPILIYGGDSSFFSHFQSGSYRLENGNTFTTVSQEKYIFELNVENEIVWELYVDSEEFTIGNIARAQKYSLNYFNPLYGDVNSNFKVDVFDLIYLYDFIIYNDYSINLDLNNDNQINLGDFDILLDLIMNN